ncbi:hypothetical protein X975_24660, partial [Stegodyphus mimosarum]
MILLSSSKARNKNVALLNLTVPDDSRFYVTGLKLKQLV